MFVLLTLYVAIDVCVVVRLVQGKATTTAPVSMLSRGQDHVVNVGSKVLMNCEFHMEAFQMFDNPIVWQKSQQMERTNINIMGSVQEPFASTRRYDLAITPQPPRYTVQLRIKDTSPEDSGNYTCELRGKKSMVLAQVSYSLQVLAPIKWLYIVLERSFVDTETPQQYLTLTEGRSVPLKCLSHGGYPPPEMTMFLGDKEITDRFRTSYTTDVTGPRGLRTLHYRTSCWSHDFTVSSADDGKTLQCVAIIAGIGMNSTNSTIYVNYAPNITCDSAEAEIGDYDVQLHCFVRSRPGPTSLYWYIDANWTIAASGDPKNEYYSLVRDRDDGALETILFMRQVHRENFRRYSLLAENQIGVTSYEVELRQKGGREAAIHGPGLVTVVQLPLPQGNQKETDYYTNLPSPAAPSTRPPSVLDLLTLAAVLHLTVLDRCFLGGHFLLR